MERCKWCGEMFQFAEDYWCSSCLFKLASMVVSRAGSIRPIMQQSEYEEIMGRLEVLERWKASFVL